MIQIQGPPWIIFTEKVVPSHFEGEPGYLKGLSSFVSIWLKSLDLKSNLFFFT